MPGPTAAWYPPDMERRSTSSAEPRELQFEYERPPEPIFFRSHERVPESKLHLVLRTLLYDFLKRAFGAHAAIGSNQFLYFRATDPKRWVAPEGFVRLAAKNDLFPNWKVWERGAPDVAVEILDFEERPWDDTLADYHEAGVRELVRFDPEAPPGQRLRIWDRVQEDLVPRVVAGERAPSRVLDGTWCLAPGDRLDVALRFEDASGVLLPTTVEATEALRAEREAARARAEAGRAAEGAERARAEAERGSVEAERARADALEAKLAALLAERGRSGS